MLSWHPPLDRHNCTSWCILPKHRPVCTHLLVSEFSRPTDGGSKVELGDSCSASAALPDHRSISPLLFDEKSGEAPRQTGSEAAIARSGQTSARLVRYPAR